MIRLERREEFKSEIHKISDRIQQFLTEFDNEGAGSSSGPNFEVLARKQHLSPKKVV
jgi:hypothetical protein